jgi:hypothetical protein
VLGPWEFSGEPGHVYVSCACLSAVWGGGPVQVYFGTFGGVDGGTVRIFLSFWLCSGGYGTVEIGKGVVRFSLLSSVCCQFSWRLDVCGRNFCVIFLCW